MWVAAQMYLSPFSVWIQNSEDLRGMFHEIFWIGRFHVDDTLLLSSVRLCKSAHSRKGLSDELCTNISDYVRRDAVWDYPMMNEDIHNMRGCCSERCTSSTQLWVSIGNGNDVLNTLRCCEKMVLQYPLSQIPVVQTLKGAVIYTDGNILG